MSSFQSFKSFIKMEQLNQQEPTQKHQTNLHNQQEDQDQISLKQQENIGAYSTNKFNKRNKKSGTICNFIIKIYNMLQEQQIHHIVNWAEKYTFHSSKLLQSQKKNQITPQNNANSFQILDIQKFEDIVLPKYFKHSNMSSFVRQLNMYGFHKLRGDKGNYEFQHQKFQKNRKDLLSDIRRKSPQFIGISSTNLQQNPLKNSFQHLKLIQDKLNQQNNRFSNTQQQLLSFHEDLNQNNIFPIENFLPLKKISHQEQHEVLNNQFLQKENIKKLQLIEEQNNRLKMIKISKLQRIKDLTSINKDNIDIKFSKIIHCFMSVKMKNQIKKAKNINSKSRCATQMKEQKQKHMELNELVSNILNKKQSQSFAMYKHKIQELMDLVK